MTRILLIEDEVLIRVMFVEALTDAGYEVVRAKNGDVATRLLREQPRFDALLTDVGLPGPMDGLAIGRLFRQSYPERPIVYVSGMPNPMSQPWPRSDKDIVLNKPCSSRNWFPASTRSSARDAG